MMLSSIYSFSTGLSSPLWQLSLLLGVEKQASHWDRRGRWWVTTHVPQGSGLEAHTQKDRITGRKTTSINYLNIATVSTQVWSENIAFDVSYPALMLVDLLVNLVKKPSGDTSIPAGKTQHIQVFSKDPHIFCWGWTSAKRNKDRGMNLIPCIGWLKLSLNQKLKLLKLVWISSSPSGFQRPVKLPITQTFFKNPNQKAHFPLRWLVLLSSSLTADHRAEVERNEGVAIDTYGCRCRGSVG